MKTSETIDKISPAFVKAQAEFGKAVKDSANPFFKSKYADLNSYLDGCSEGLRNNGLAILQDTSGSEASQMISVTTRVIHVSGQWFESEPLILHPTDMKPQSFGSAQTYGRRYSLASFLGLGAEDDDGNRASAPKPAEQKKPETKTPIGPIRDNVIKAIEACDTEEKLETMLKGLVKKYTAQILNKSTGFENEIWMDLINEKQRALRK